MTQARNLSVASAEFDATGERRDREIPRHFVFLPGGFLVLGEAAAIGVDAARLIVLEIDVSDFRRDYELERSNRRHHARHARRHAGDANVRPLAAGGLVGQTRLENRLVFGRERLLLGAAGRLGLVPLVADAWGLRRWPDRSGYFVSSKACAPAVVVRSAPASA